MPLKLEPITLADRSAVSHIIARANFDDPYGQTVWPHSTIEARTRGNYLRLPQTFLKANVWLIKVVDGERTIAYAQWTLPHHVYQKLRREQPSEPVSDEMRKHFERDYEEATEGGWPKGIRVDFVEHCSPAMEKANEMFPQDDEYISMQSSFSTSSKSR